MTTQILSRNYSNSELVAGLTASSEASGFPKENVTDFVRRTKVWRSGGHYRVVSGSNTIVFEETAATPLTATITPGSYASFALLATEIKTQLEAEGGSTYTITQDTTTLKAKIASNGSGGGGIFNINWTDATGIGSILGYNTTVNDTGSLTYTADSLKISTGEFFIYDFGIPLNPDAIVVSWRQDEINSINETAVLSVKGNYTNNFDGSVGYSGQTNKTDFGFYLQKGSSNEGLATTAFRYWKLEIIDTDNPTGFIEIGSIFIGEFIDFVRGQVQFPFSSSWEDGSIKQTTDSGQIVSNQKYLTRVFDAEWFALTRSEKEEFDEFFQEVKTADPFYLMLDPNQVIGSTVEQNVIFVRFNSVPKWTMEFPGIFSVSASFREDI